MRWLLSDLLDFFSVFSVIRALAASSSSESPGKRQIQAHMFRLSILRHAIMSWPELIDLGRHIKVLKCCSKDSWSRSTAQSVINCWHYHRSIRSNNKLKSLCHTLVQQCDSWTPLLGLSRAVLSRNQNVNHFQMEMRIKVYKYIFDKNLMISKKKTSCHWPILKSMYPSPPEMTSMFLFLGFSGFLDFFLLLSTVLLSTSAVAALRPRVGAPE